MRTIAYVKCTCPHQGQDELHGPQIRLANALKIKDPKDPRREVRCSVCGKIHATTVDKIK